MTRLERRLSGRAMLDVLASEPAGADTRTIFEAVTRSELPQSVRLHSPSLTELDLAAVAEVFRSGHLAMGTVTGQFEDAVRSLTGAEHVVAVNNGTSALHLALAALDLDPGSEVLLPSLTFAATAQAVLAAGLRPVFCEVDERDLNLDVEDAGRRISGLSGAIIPVHYGGVPCNMDRILTLAAAHKLRVVEDAAHAFGSSYNGKQVGGFGDIACFSFDAIKTITCGEGGAVATGDAKAAEKIRRMRRLGIEGGWVENGIERDWGYTVGGAGFRYHMPNLNAAIGLAQLTRLDAFVARRRAVASAYDASFLSLDQIVVPERDLRSICPFSYVVRVSAERRDGLMASLRQKGIGTGVHYVPCHLQPAFGGTPGALPVTEGIFRQILSLPLHVEMTDEDVAEVINAVQEFFA